MQYEVRLSHLAEKQYNNILSYLLLHLRNSQAVAQVIDDFDSTIKRLEENAGAFGYCCSDRLRKLGFHKVHFSTHRYLMVYRILDEDIVIVEGIYHELQDYENAIG